MTDLNDIIAQAEKVKDLQSKAKKSQEAADAALEELIDMREVLGMALGVSPTLAKAQKVPLWAVATLVVSGLLVVSSSGAVQILGFVGVLLGTAGVIGTGLDFEQKS